MAKGNQDRVGKTLYTIYLVVLLCSVAVVARILWIQLFWKPNPQISQRLTQPVREVVLEPARGSILADDGSPLAMSYPRYQFYIDCRARGTEFQMLSKDARADSVRAWKAKAAIFAKGLAETFGDGKRTAAWYEKLLCDSYDKGSRYLKLGRPVEKEVRDALMKYPLANEGKYKGGVWAETTPARRYPYGDLARRTIGSVTENEEASWYSGIEGKFNHALHGSRGSYWIKRTDNGWIRDYDSTYTKAVDGMDIRTTLNVDYQEIADKALRGQIEGEEDLEAACLVLMDVKSGAIKAMVNLERDGKGGKFSERNNVAVLRRGEPGSVWKITTLMTAIEDGIVKDVDQTIPGNGGVLPGYKFEKDKHIVEYEQKHHTKNIPLRYCVAVSSNYAFRYLALMNYADHPSDFTDRLFQYQLGTSFDFDVHEKITTPSIRNPKDKNFTKTDLGQVAMGYGASVTPMHILTYYNAIANKGVMMKPYLVEDVEKDGKVVTYHGPSTLNQCICKKETALMITDALSAVTDAEGTAWRLKNAKCNVSGKTGTANIVVNPGSKDAYHLDGKHKQQGTFVGFFPSEDPQYTIICTIYTDLTKKDYFGGTIPVKVVREVIDRIHDIDPYWNESI